MSFLSDNNAYIPLIFCVSLSIVLTILSVIAKKRKPASIHFALIPAILIFFIGSVLSLFLKKLVFIGFTVLAENILFIPVILKLLRQENKSNENEKTIDSSAEESIVASEEIESVYEKTKDLREACNEIMIQASASFSKEAGIVQLLDYINTKIRSVVPSDGCAILLLDDFEDILAVKSFTGTFPPPYELPENLPHKKVRIETNFRFAEFPLENNIFASFIKTGQPGYINDPDNDERIFKNGPEDFLKNGPYMFLPMKVHDTATGIIVLSRTHDNISYTADEFEDGCIVANFAAAAVRNMYSFQEVFEHAELTKESDIACKMQHALHPQVLPVIPSITIGSIFNTSEGVCGDYYDVIPSRKDRISFFLADVAGKGMNSLIVMVMIRAILRLIVNTRQSAGTILEWANRGIAAEKNIDHFASATLINYDSTTKTMEYANAGTTPILHFCATEKTCKKISSVSEPIGVEKTSHYENCTLVLQKNDIVVMYSDGIEEAMNIDGQQYSSKRLCDMIERTHSENGKTIAAAIQEDLKRFCGSAHQHDDQTLLVIKIR